MEQIALLHIELLGLQAAQQVLQKRIDEIQASLNGQRKPVVQTPTAKQYAPPSKAKLDALAKARATLAQRRKQEAAAGNGKGKKVGGNSRVKARSKKGPAGTAAA